MAIQNQNQNEQKSKSIDAYPYSHSFQTASTAQSVSVLSWNVVYPDFCDQIEFPYASKEDTIWKNRLPKIKQKMATSNADIICLQEISKKNFGRDIGEDFRSKHGYEYIVNMGSKKSKVDFTTAIMFKSDKFECKWEDHRARATILCLTNKLSQSQSSKCSHTHPDNICLYHSIFIVDVHLESAYKKGKDDSARVNAIKSIMKRIKFCLTEKLRLNEASELENIRIIVTGDWNSGFEEAPAQMLLSHDEYSFADVHYERIKCAKYDLHSLPMDDVNVRMKYFPSYCAHDRLLSIDLMIYTENNLKLKGVANTLPEEMKEEIGWNKVMSQRIEEWKERKKRIKENEDDEHQYNLADYSDILKLPNKKLPSDHLPIAAVFEFVDVCAEMNKDEEKCRCCLAPRKPEKKKKKKNKNKGNQQREFGHVFHEINSF